MPKNMGKTIQEDPKFLQLWWALASSTTWIFKNHLKLVYLIYCVLDIEKALFIFYFPIILFR